MALLQFNAKNQQAVDRADNLLAWGGLVISTVTSGICLASVGMALAGETSPFQYSIWDEPIAYLNSAIICVVAFTIAYSIDFLLINRNFYNGLSYVIAARTGRFESYTLARNRSYVRLTLGILGIVISGFTSFWGTRFISSATAANIKIENVRGKERAALEDRANKSVADISNEIKLMESKREALEKSLGSSELRRLAKSGNDWAKSELEGLKSGNKELKALDADIAKMRKRRDEVTDKARNEIDKELAQINALVDMQREGQISKISALNIILNLVGVLGLIMGIVAIYLKSSCDVEEAITGRKRYTEPQAPKVAPNNQPAPRNGGVYDMSNNAGKFTARGY